MTEAFRTTPRRSRAAGFGKNAIQRKDGITSDKTQRRLRETIEAIDKVESRFGSALMACAWYRSYSRRGRKVAITGKAQSSARRMMSDTMKGATPR